MSATLATLTRDELLRLTMETDTALAWAESIGRDTEAQELRASRHLISADWTRRETKGRRHRNAY